MKNKLDLRFQDMGAKKVKNIATPVHHFYITIDNQAVEQRQPFLKRQSEQIKKILTPIKLIVVVIAILFLVLLLQDNQSSSVVQDIPEKNRFGD